MRFAQQLSAGAALLASSAAALAHDGHHMSGSHWHPTDASGFALLAVFAGIALWLSRGD
jgi:hypothetical protein